MKNVIGRIALAIGILFAPFIFSWFTLARGFSIFTRVLSFGWLAVVCISIFIDPGNDPVPADVQKPELIPFEILKRNEMRPFKHSLDLQVPLIGGRLPTEEELGKLSRHLVKQAQPYERTFVSFYLPGMVLDAGAFATAHHNPDMKVLIGEEALLAYPQYHHFVSKELVDVYLELLEKEEKSNNRLDIPPLPQNPHALLVRHTCYAFQSSLLCDDLKMRVDTQHIVEKTVGSQFRGPGGKYSEDCKNGIEEALNGVDCPTIWRDFGCDGGVVPNLIQQNPFRLTDPILCRFSSR